jgi:hypothetical protein
MKEKAKGFTWRTVKAMDRQVGIQVFMVKQFSSRITGKEMDFMPYFTQFKAYMKGDSAGSAGRVGEKDIG